MNYYPQSPYQPYYSNYAMPYGQFPQFPQSEQAEQMVQKPMYPHLKDSTLNTVKPFVNYGLQEGKKVSFAHSMTEVAAMTYLIGKGMDPQTAYLTVESWEVNESY